MKVIALGGSVLFGDLETENVRKFAHVIDSYGKKLAIVVGGGKIARRYIEMARELGSDEVTCDIIGIDLTRINARILASALENCPKTIPNDFIRAKELLDIYEKVVLGGTFPGHTTDATSALLAEFLEAEELLIATSTDGVYTKDPKIHKDAKKIKKITPDELVEIVSQNSLKAGSSSVVDLLASKVIQRSGIKTKIFLGTPDNLKRALKGENVGTVVSY